MISFSDAILVLLQSSRSYVFRGFLIKPPAQLHHFGEYDVGDKPRTMVLGCSELVVFNKIQ